jgi:hypothetical protein
MARWLGTCGTVGLRATQLRWQHKWAAVALWKLLFSAGVWAAVALWKLLFSAGVWGERSCAVVDLSFVQKAMGVRALDACPVANVACPLGI